MKRIQLRRTKGWRIPPDAVYVGRPSLWGNPWSLHDVQMIYPEVVPADRADIVVGLYRRELSSLGLLSDYAYVVSEERWEALRRAVTESGAKSMAEYAAVALRGRDLACWCPLEDSEGRRAPCHADVLLELANPGWRAER